MSDKVAGLLDDNTSASSDESFDSDDYDDYDDDDDDDDYVMKLI